jgi:uncharacterized cupredoxin-like copper-binding protein
MKKLAVMMGVILALSMLLTACGGGSGSGSSGSSINTTMTEFKFDPAAWTVTAGQSVSLKLTNSGSVEHSWVLLSKPVTGNTFTDADKANILFSKTVPAGQTATVTFTAPATAGDYQVVCDVPGHLEAGMMGKLTVK